MAPPAHGNQHQQYSISHTRSTAGCAVAEQLTPLQKAHELCGDRSRAISSSLPETQLAMSGKPCKAHHDALRQSRTACLTARRVGDCCGLHPSAAGEHRAKLGHPHVALLVAGTAVGAGVRAVDVVRRRGPRVEHAAQPCEGAQRQDVLLDGVVEQLGEGDVECRDRRNQPEPACAYLTLPT